MDQRDEISQSEAAHVTRRSAHVGLCHARAARPENDRHIDHLIDRAIGVRQHFTVYVMIARVNFSEKKR